MLSDRPTRRTRAFGQRCEGVATSPPSERSRSAHLTALIQVEASIEMFANGPIPAWEMEMASTVTGRRQPVPFATQDSGEHVAQQAGLAGDRPDNFCCERKGGLLGGHSGESTDHRDQTHGERRFRPHFRSRRRRARTVGRGSERST